MAGRSLIEFLVAMTLSSVLLGAVMVSVSGSSLSGRKQDGLAAMTENGQVAVSMIAASLRMSGYWQPTSEINAIDQPTDGQPMLRGCRSGFVDAAAPWNALACDATDPAASDAVAVRYEAGEAGTPMAMDCAATDVRTLGMAIIGDRYFVQSTGTPSGNPALLCQPTSGGGAQVLVDDVERMDLRYGVSPVVAAPMQNRAFDALTVEGRTERYLRADQLVSDCTPGSWTSMSWCAVTSVRVCVVMRSAEGAADAGPITYLDCNGALQTTSDRRMRRAISTTVSLRNRIVPLAPAASAGPSP